MSHGMRISEELTVGPQPIGEEIRSLAADGFKSVINFRTEGDEA